MTNLSPAAQAVLQAACIHHGLFNEEIVQRRRNIAAVLRAAADQVAVTDMECPGVTLWEQGFRAGAAGATQGLLVIAAELEANA